MHNNSPVIPVDNLSIIPGFTMLYNCVFGFWFWFEYSPSLRVLVSLLVARFKRYLFAFFCAPPPPLYESGLIFHRKEWGEELHKDVQKKAQITWWRGGRMN